MFGLSSKIMMGITIAAIALAVVMGLVAKHYVGKAATVSANLVVALSVAEDSTKKLAVAKELNEILNNASMRNSMAIMNAEKARDNLQTQLEGVTDESGCLDTPIDIDMQL